MPAKRFLLDFEVEAHGCLREGVGTIRSTHPHGHFEVHISNLAVKAGTDRPLLSVQLIVPGDDIDQLKEPSINLLKEYLHYLTFATNLTYRIHKLVQIIDWTLGLKARQCIQYEDFPGANLPYQFLENEIFGSVEVLQQAQIPTALKRALNWFSNGVSSQYPDDQFQFFWLVLELLAQLHKDPQKVNDSCPKCKSPLYCETCQTHPTHRPYPKQAIRQLFKKIVKDNPIEFFDLSNKIRNAIMHGDDVEEIEKAKNIELSSIVDSLGSIAWIAILNTFRNSFKEPPNVERLCLLQANMYSHQVLTVAAHLIVYSSNPDSPTLAELTKPEISLVFHDEEAT